MNQFYKKMKEKRKTNCNFMIDKLTDEISREIT